MIIVVHHNNSLVKVVDKARNELPYTTKASLCNDLFALAEAYPNELLLWCDQDYVDDINFSEVSSVFQNKRIMASYSVAKQTFLPKQIGYVEDSPFIKVNYDVQYPTWQMSSDIGGIHSSVLNTLNPTDFQHKNFNYFLNSLAKRGIDGGLLCYSAPLFLKTNAISKLPQPKVSKRLLFKFIKEHYKGVWVFLAFLSFLIFEKKFMLFPFLASLFVIRKKKIGKLFDEISLSEAAPNLIDQTVDVIIPTMGRKSYLYDVLKDLEAQSVLPKRVIIIEQNAESSSNSELDYLTTETWSFEIIHKFIHQTGACNARNLGINEVRSNWVFLADDDIRFQETMLENSIQFLLKYHAKAVTLSCLREGDVENETEIKQWNSFGSGCSVVASEVVKTTFFDMGFEHGFGEDTDYGMQLRNKGIDVLYNPFVKLKHLKAPVGGFRKPIKKAWEKEAIPPKPSPTIMLHRLKHTTLEQRNGYKLQLFIKYYRNQSTKNPFAYLKKMKKSWNQSVYWAKKLHEV